MGPTADPVMYTPSVLAVMAQNQPQAHGMTEGQLYMGPNLHKMFHEELQPPCVVTGVKQCSSSPLL